MTAFPPTRKITRASATELRCFDISVTGKQDAVDICLPENDGEDDPGFEYETVHTVGGEVLRVPLRHR